MIGRDANYMYIYIYIYIHTCNICVCVSKDAYGARTIVHPIDHKQPSEKIWVIGDMFLAHIMDTIPHATMDLFTSVFDLHIQICIYIYI